MLSSCCAPITLGESGSFMNECEPTTTSCIWRARVTLKENRESFAYCPMNQEGIGGLYRWSAGIKSGRGNAPQLQGERLR